VNENMEENKTEVEQLEYIIVEEAKQEHVISDLPYFVKRNIEFAEDWEDFKSNGIADELNEFISRVTEEMGRHSVNSTSDCISFYAYVLYLLTDRRVITNEEIARLNKELEGPVGDIIFERCRKRCLDDVKLFDCI